jgi:hypothetical protein
VTCTCSHEVLDDLVCAALFQTVRKQVWNGVVERLRHLEQTVGLKNIQKSCHCGKNGLIQVIAERCYKAATTSCVDDKMDHSLVAAKNDSVFHRSFDTASCTEECSRMFHYVL